MSTESTDIETEEASADDEGPTGAEAAARATELAGELGAAIERLDSYQAFAEAKAAVEEDSETQEQIREFEQTREEFMLARQTGDATKEDLRALQQAQERLHDIPVMSEYIEAQSRLEAELEELNRTISEPLSVDFGEKAGGCCQD